MLTSHEALDAYSSKWRSDVYAALILDNYAPRARWSAETPDEAAGEIETARFNRTGDAQ